MTMVISAGAANPEKPTILIDNILTIGDAVTSSETSDGAGDNALSDGTFDYWTADAATATMSIDMIEPVYCDGVGIAAHTLATDSATLDVQSSDDNADWTTRLTVTPTSDDTIFGIFPLVLARYWRIRITNGPASIGVIKLGRRIIVPTGVILGHVGIDHARRVELLSNDSVNGQFLGTRIIRQSADVTIDFGLVPRSFLEGDFSNFEKGFNDGRTFFYAGSPVNLPNDVGYCKRSTNAQEIRPPYEGGDLMQLDFEAQVYVG